MERYYAIVEFPFVYSISNILCDMDVIRRYATDKRIISILNKEEKEDLKGFEEFVVSGKFDPKKKEEVVARFEREVGALFLNAYSNLEVSFCKYEDLFKVLKTLRERGDRFTCGVPLYNRPDENKLNITEK